MSSNETKMVNQKLKLGQDKIILEERFGEYVKPTADTQAKYKTIQEYILEVALMISETCPDSLEKSKALTDLQSCKMFANASVALHS